MCASDPETFRNPAKALRPPRGQAPAAPKDLHRPATAHPKAPPQPGSDTSEDLPQPLAPSIATCIRPSISERPSSIRLRSRAVPETSQAHVPVRSVSGPSAAAPRRVACALLRYRNRRRNIAAPQGKCSAAWNFHGDKAWDDLGNFLWKTRISEAASSPYRWIRPISLVSDTFDDFLRMQRRFAAPENATRGATSESRPPCSERLTLSTARGAGDSLDRGA